jgi:hypothetical protein
MTTKTTTRPAMMVATQSKIESDEDAKEEKVAATRKATAAATRKVCWRQKPARSLHYRSAEEPYSPPRRHLCLAKNRRRKKRPEVHAHAL